MSDAKIESNASAKSSADPKPFYLRPRFIVAAIAAIIFLVLILQNMESVLVEIFFWKVSAPAALVYFFFVVAGFVAARLTVRKNQESPKAK
ncbi:MAG: hypothetical protein ACSHX5_00565 [Phycisphaerales bacterium]